MVATVRLAKLQIASAKHYHSGMFYVSVVNNQHCHYGHSAVTMFKTSISTELKTNIKQLPIQRCCSFCFILRIVVIYHPYKTLYHLF